MDNLVIETELVVVSEELLVAELTLHTMTGKHTFQINDSVATGLAAMLVKFVKEAKPS